jgi:hypothetical protein
MAITAVNIAQNNIVGDSNLMAVHSPLIFLINASYSGASPENFYCKVYDEDDTLLGTFKCIPYLDILATLRQFMFIADSILRGFMYDFSDELQSAGSLEHIEDMTKIFKLEFGDFVTAFTDEITIVALHSNRQFGEDINQTEIFNNEDKTYYGYEGKPVYMYIYNDSEANSITTVPIESGYDYALDYDDTIFADAVDEDFIIFTS